MSAPDNSPILVHLVKDDTPPKTSPSREVSSSFVTRTFDGNGNPNQQHVLAHHQPNRKRALLLISNPSAANPLFIVSNDKADAQALSGFSLPAGTILELTTTSEIWVSCAAGVTATVSIVQEFRS